VISLFSDKMELNVATGTLLDAYMTFANMALALMMLVASLYSLMYVKEHILVNPSRAFVEALYEELPLT